MNAQELLRKHQWSGFRWLHGHELLGEEYWEGGRGARWVIGERGTFTHRCEVIAGIGGSLIVHGDFDIARFGHYGDRGDAFSRLCWMGLCTDVGYYVKQKASIGMGRRGSIEYYDEDVAHHEIEQYIHELDGRNDGELISVLTESLEHTDTEHGQRRFLSEEDQGWDLWEHSFGMAMDPHVVISHVALNKTASLLIDKYGKEGPPECRTIQQAAE